MTSSEKFVWFLAALVVALVVGVAQGFLNHWGVPFGVGFPVGLFCGVWYERARTRRWVADTLAESRARYPGGVCDG